MCQGMQHLAPGDTPQPRTGSLSSEPTSVSKNMPCKQHSSGQTPANTDFKYYRHQHLKLFVKKNTEQWIDTSLLSVVLRCLQLSFETYSQLP